MYDSQAITPGLIGSGGSVDPPDDVMSLVVVVTMGSPAGVENR